VQQAFDELVEAHHAELLRYARRLLGAHCELAEDALQEALLKAFRHLSSSDSWPQNPRAWLFAVVHNTIVDSLRTPNPAVSLGEHQLAATGPTPAELAEQREWLDWLMGAIGALPVRQRDALVGHALEGRSYRELANREQTTVSAIKTLIHRARRGLADTRSPFGLLGAPFMLVSRGIARRALAGKLSANGMAGFSPPPSAPRR
jgi:RNA polymerase sigma factor (sigma-70 family)